MKVLLVEDHLLFRDGVSLILERLDPNTEITPCGTGADAFALAQQHADFSLVLLDYNLPDTTGLNCLAQIQAHLPTTPIVMLSAENKAELIQQVLAAGARGFITKTSPSDVMISAIKLVLSGGVYIPQEMISALNMPFTAHSSDGITHAASPAPQTAPPATGDHQLTERQLHVLHEMLKGLSNKEIARELNMSPSTVKVHVAAILREFNVKNRTQAVAHARQKNIITQ
ncbi:response regulator [Saccharophagus degradans]|uniref:Transcriptional regulator, XRE family n=1 Tax=Saccharophagus degradans (strain 2-40 / ATCC 43961 / DSM 17024) TaxID=203122 RepID=Q21KE6_SACD2|nr:response regulator transcription factor [Saccharophagus degradans]ABD80833.1 transcriptional regulator, XRE family [Saccharophagus degradans 2-40]